MQDLVEISSFSGVMSRLLLVFLCQPGGFSIEQLARLSGVQDLKSARLALIDLQEKHGLVSCAVGAHGRHVWRLAGSLRLVAGRLSWEAEARAAEQLPCTPEEGQSPRQPAETQPVGKNPCMENQVEAVDDNQPGEIPLPESGPAAATRGESPRQEGESGQMGANPRAEARPMTIDSSIKESLNSDSLNSESLKTGSADSLRLSEQTERNKFLLGKTDLLFDRKVIWHEAFTEKPPEEILGWLAQACQGRRAGKLKRPWGFVYHGLLGKLRQKMPDRQFRARPWDYLPDDYLLACGLKDGPGKYAALMDASLPAPGADWPPAAPQEQAGGEADDCDPGQVPFPDFPDRRIARAWQMFIELSERTVKVYALLQALKDSRPAAWDEASACLTVAAASPEAVEWLQDRLTQISSQQISSMLDRAGTRVVFVAA